IIILPDHPFYGVILWLLVMPFVSVLPYSSMVYWVIYRGLPPLLLGLVVLSRILKPHELPRMRLGPPELALGILVFLIPGSILLFQTDPNLALIRFADRMILPFCMYSAIRLMAPREREFTHLQWLALFIAISQSIIGFLSWSAPQVLPHAWQYLQGYRTTGSLRDADLYATLLTFSATLLIHAAVNHKSGLIRLFFFLAAGLCAIFVFLSLERAAWLGGVFVIVGLIYLYPKTMFRLLITGSIIVAGLGTGVLSTHFAKSISRFNESDPINDRIVVFDAMYLMFQAKPVLGWGYETLDQSIQHYYRRVGEASITTRLVTSHNTYMTILTELGIVGFTLYMFPTIWWFIFSIRVWRRMGKKGRLSRSLLGILWLGMLFNFTVSNFMDMRWFEIGITLWWLTLGLIANLVYPYLRVRNIRLRSHSLGATP
ncbi:MAG: O-antigen ligase family protein, partial [Anaerolineaceae bacterium]|nr:O-antigen ligase family protein [Anaerolineaceae bacterium]